MAEQLKSIYHAAFVVTTWSFITGITFALAEVSNAVKPDPIIGGYVVFNHLIPDQTFWTTIVGLIGATIMATSKTVEAVIAWRKHKAEMRELSLREEKLNMEKFAFEIFGDRRYKYEPVQKERRAYAGNTKKLVSLDHRSDSVGDCCE